MKLGLLHEYGEELERRLRLQSFPLAIKLLKSEENIPEGAKRPLRDLGYHLLLCQGFAMSRREEEVVVMLKEDMWCFEPVVGYGIAEPPQAFLEGHNRFPKDVMTLEAGANYAHEFPRLELGRCIGVASAPLTTTPFEPDVVMLYCNPTQLSLILLGKECKDGFSLKCSLSSHAACVYGVVPSIQSGEFHVAVPCRGDRGVALAGDDEMVFTAPLEKLEDLMMGLRYVHETGSKLPMARKMQPDSELPPGYAEIGRMVGLDTK